jgi:Zn-dependent peptidase ImmA (M78 family)
MKWVRDRTGRFPQRPYYEGLELDSECENIISSFLIEKYGKVTLPISTNDLTILIEQKTSELDLYSDLSNEGNNVEGMTIFSRTTHPRVLISNTLSTSSSHTNRLRTTLTHEFGHVVFHNFIWAFEQPSLFKPDSDNLTIKCNRDTILNARDVDWLEWQAGYASGAFLMPLSSVKEIVHRINIETNSFGKVSISSDIGQRMIKQVQSVFQVSEDAARVRLLKLDYIQEGKVVAHSKSLF